MANVANKRHARESTLLAELVTALEADDAVRLRAALSAVLDGGPLSVSQASLDDSTVTELRSELRLFLRTVVQQPQEHEGGLLHEVTARRSIRFGSLMDSATRRVVMFADGETRDLVVLQFILLLMDAGLTNVRTCPVDQKLFVRIRRQEYCSSSCQHLAFMRKIRGERRERAERRARARRRRVRKG